jgi:iron complex outermembrane recepter protein
MKSRSKLAGGLRWSPLAVAIAMSIASAPVVAQDDDPATLERVEVTGSRIKRAEAETQSPVLVLDREDLQSTGLTSVADIVQQLTASGSALNTKFNSSGNFGFPPDGSGVGAGSATVDLRNLGSKRVLVLVDGIRWVNEASASGVSSSTDLNTIPVSIIERIEVLEDGASAIYGSDAIAGVINIITRDTYDGLSASGYYGEFDKGGATKAADVSFGGSGENFSAFLNVSYTDQEEISSAETEFSRFPVPGTGVALGSSRVPGGRTRFTLPNGTRLDLIPAPGQTQPVFDRTQTGCTRTDGFRCFTGADAFNFAPFNLLLTPNERKGIFGQARYDFGNDVSWYARVLYNQRESANQAAAEPITLGPGSGNAFSDNVFIPASQPFNPFGIDLRASGPGANLATLRYRPLEGGPRRFTQDVDTWYFGTGLEGTFDWGDRVYSWDVNYATSENEADQTNLGSYNIRRIVDALGPNCGTIPGCVPLDLFGFNSITPAMLAYISPIVRDTSENSLELFSANLTGDLFQMPAGPLAFATGYEHRRLEGSYTPDAITIAGEYNGVPSLPTAGSYDVDEFYVELNVPVYEASPSHRLDLSVAGRYSDYSTFGGETTGKFGARWQLGEQFLVRGTYAEGFRAPSIGELFGSASRFDATLVDPCLTSPSGAPPTGNRANCAALGVPAGAVQLDPQIGVSTGGNINLEPETSDSFTVGFVWSPSFGVNSSWSRSFDFAVSYWDYEIEGAISAIDAQTQLNLCVATLNPQFCDGITRIASGEIDTFDNFLTNLGSIETDGVDFDVRWALPEHDWGMFELTWQNTYVDDYVAIGAGGDVQPQTVGVEVNNSAIPEWTSTLRLDWRFGDFGAGYTARYISDLEEECGDAADFPVCGNPTAGTNSLGSTTYGDVRFTWDTQWLEGTRLTLGVNNVWDKDPPICLSCTLNGYDASTYDPPVGRFWYARFDVKF